MKKQERPLKTKTTPSNYDLQVEKGKEIFMEYDQEMLIQRFQLTADELYIYLNYINVPCRISRSSGQIEENLTGDKWTECRSYNTVMTIYDLLCYPKEKTAPGLSGSWCPVGSFAVMGSPDPLIFTQKYAWKFQNHRALMEEACKKLGGKLQKSLAGADITCLIQVTPYFPVLLQFWEGDDEFAPRLSLLWDENSMKFLHFETAYLLQSDLLNRLEKTAF